jgi:hypothetical protein
VYDMYPWDGSADPAGRPPHGDSSRVGTRYTNAVQVALDRRDNGGDAAAAPGTPAAGPARQ